MKKLTRLILLAAIMLAWGSNVAELNAAAYCQAPITANDGVTIVKLSCQLISAGNYQIKVESDVAMTNFAAGVYCNINGVGGNQVIALPGYVRSADGKTITVNIPSSSAPNLYTPLYILMPGEKNFAWPTGITWGTCVAQTDFTLPVMGTAVLVGSPTYNSANVTFTGTDDVTSPVTNYVLNDAPNSITNKVVVVDASGNGTITGLNPATTYNFTVKARDAAFNVSANSASLQVITTVRASDCTGNKGHFGNPTVLKIHYTIQYSGGNVIYTVTPIDAARTLSLVEVQTTLGNYAMTIAGDGKSATYTQTGLTAGANLGILFMYKLDNMPGNEMTAQSSSLSDVNSIFYKVGDCAIADLVAPTAFTATLGAVTSNSVELLLNASDNLSVIVYTVTYGTTPTVVTKNGVSGSPLSYVITGLTPGTLYNFSVVAKDAAGNPALNNPIAIAATTTAIPTPQVSAPTPTVAASNVISIFSNAYTNVANTNFAPGWGQVTTYNAITVGATDNVIKYANMNYQGIQFGSTQDVSSMKYLHIDVWTSDANAATFPITLIWGAEKTITKPISTNGTWTSLDIPLSEFTGAVLSTAIQFKFQSNEWYTLGAAGSTAKFTTIYLDNLYFWTDVAPSLVVSTAALTIAQPATSTNTFGITTASSWTVASDQTWLTPSSLSGTGNATITLTAATVNDTYFARTANVTITGSGTTKTIVVTQAPLLPIAPPAPTVVPAKVKSIYSDTYTPAVTVTAFDNWWNMNFYNCTFAVGNNGKKVVTTGAGNCGSPTFAGTPLDITGMTYVHVDVYPLSTIDVGLQFVTVTPTTANWVSLGTLTVNQWNSKDIPLTSFTNSVKTDLKQVGFVTTASFGTFYMDNLYFYNDLGTGVNQVATNSVKCYPSQVIDRLNVKADTEISQVVVRNLLGQSVKSVAVNSNEESIDLSAVSKGNYFVTVKLANGQSATQKIVKL